MQTRTIGTRSTFPFLATAAATATTLLGITAAVLAGEQPSNAAPEKVFHSFSETGGGITAVAFSPDGQRALTGSTDGVLRLWELSSGNLLQRMTGHTGHLRAVAFLPDGRRALSAALDKTLRLWSLESGKEVNRLTGPPVPGQSQTYWKLQSISFSADGSRGITQEGRSVRIWDLKSLRHIRTLPAFRGRLEAAAIAPDGRTVLLGGSDARVHLWDIKSGREIRVMRGHTDYVRSVAFSPDGQLAASGARDRRVIIWDLASGRPLRTFRSHRGWTNQVAFSSDGRQVLSGGGHRDHTVRLSPITGGSERVVVTAPSAIFSVAFTADGRHALLGTASGIGRYQLADKPVAIAPSGTFDIKAAAIEAAWQQLDGGTPDQLVLGAPVIGSHGVPADLARYLPLLDQGLKAMGRHPGETRGFRSDASTSLVAAG